MKVELFLRMYRSTYPPWHYLEVSGELLRHGHFTPGTQWICGWGGPRANLDTWSGEKSSSTGIRAPIPRPSSPYPVATLTVLLITKTNERIIKVPVSRYLRYVDLMRTLNKEQNKYMREISN